MSRALDFILAARRSEIQGLQQLDATCELVAKVSQLVHTLQRERGYSNIHLGSPDDQCQDALDALTAQSKLAESVLLDGFEQPDLNRACAAEKVRLFNHIAAVLHGLEGLVRLRAAVRRRTLSAEESTAAFSRPIAALLAVVFEAADTASDPKVTRCLVALFNMMQGKELAGQERATGVAGFINGWFSPVLIQRLHFLGESQQRCFETFVDFSTPEALLAWKALAAEPWQTEIEQLRLVAMRSSEQQPIPASLHLPWFELTTTRIDAFKAIEDQLTLELRNQCHCSIAEASAELDNHRALLKRLGSMDSTAASPGTRLYNVQATELESVPGDAMGHQLNRSVLDLVHEQNQRLLALHDELAVVRTSLDERKWVERAKGLLMEQHKVNEPEAYRLLQQAAMSQGVRLLEVARTLINQEKGRPGR
ncbi:nitrate- and nitrite sensing domain-containing protein [Halopseudomonas salegens]|uniref:ANTAR domain-containing protein n=1 Tax=Halopseudomonas salegens TaxID=1434072 RepID=A0A1H2FTL1_9GAMM|nr:nitrate- and nitrite sensing domain-containing protein [Halopseudomonas salegens]SDU10675.1 ANTAR domain-containing protein [Halopseudomonas salegens]